MKTKITLSYERLTIVEFTQMLSRSVALVEQKEFSFGSDDMVEGLFNRVKNGLPALEAAIKPKRGSDLTESVQDLYKTRNLDIRALFDSIKPFKASRNKEKVAAYRSLEHLFNQYRDINRQTIEGSSVLVKSLLTKLAQDNISKQVTLLGIEEYVTNLIDSNQRYNTAYLKRSQELSERVVIDVRQLRKNLTDDYKLLYSHLQNKIAYNPKAEEKGLLRLINEVRQDYADLINRRKSKAKKKEEASRESSTEKD